MHGCGLYVHVLYALTVRTLDAGLAAARGLAVRLLYEGLGAGFTGLGLATGLRDGVSDGMGSGWATASLGLGFSVLRSAPRSTVIVGLGLLVDGARSSGKTSGASGLAHAPSDTASAANRAREVVVRISRSPSRVRPARPLPRAVTGSSPARAAGPRCADQRRPGQRRGVPRPGAWRPPCSSAPRCSVAGGPGRHAP